ncbi:hypothetical protein BB559_001177 [Furculomyces boomerangus]|uniref:TOG domain-containing protein n=2 Tax=Harpellales TaxID=61421 RepID=A0A2T9Z2U4_9FUNG|nr:hypothetical protein BB559_001177 [Furculomyces boomerangus]PWA01812.1 hypothetical protein BB558_002054 [Smittium angustum]
MENEKMEIDGVELSMSDSTKTSEITSDDIPMEDSAINHSSTDGTTVDGENDTVYPIAVLIDELKHEDLSLRLNAIRSLNTIALALGAQRTRDELISFLDESIDDEDEVLLVLAEELGRFVQYVGGDEYAYTIIRPLENLASTEEPVVRDKAVESINVISDAMDQSQVEKYLVPCIARLSQGDWFTSRSSAAKLYPKAYVKALPETKEKLKIGFEKLCNDETPMTRRSAAGSLKDFISVLSPEDVVEYGIKNFVFLSNDDQDSVRLLTIEPLIEIAQILTGEQNLKHLSESLNKLCSDKSWRLARALKDDSLQAHLGEVGLQLMEDQEAEVRGAVCTQLAGFSEIMSLDTLIEKVLPRLQTLSEDSMQHVRANLAKNVTGLCEKFGPEKTVEHLLPLFLRILKDSFPEVRLNIISQLEQINKVVGIEQLSQSLLPAIFELAEDKQWRVRLAIIEYVPLLASQLGVQFFDEKLSNLSMAWLGDPVYSIRNAATVNLKALIEVFGVEWACKSIIPKIMAMANHPNYLYRITTIFAITTLAPTVSSAVIRDLVLPTVETLMNDPIPNIRFNVAKSLEALTPVLKSDAATSSLVDTKVKAILKKLSEDPDQDVRFFANKASFATGITV